MFQTRRFRIVWSDSLHLPVLSLLCAWARHSKCALKGAKQRARPCCPLQKLLLIKKFYHLKTLHLYPAQTRKRTKKELPNSYITLLNYRHPIVRFLQKMRAWSRSKSLWLITTLVQITNYTSPNYTDHPQVNTHCIEHFLTVHDFLATCACPENFHCIEYTFYHSGFLSNFVLALKNRVALKFFTVLNIRFTIRIFEQLALALKKRECPEIFHCIECAFHIQDFWATCACPENQSCPGVFHSIEYTFYIQDFWATCACLENRICPEIFQARGTYLQNVTLFAEWEIFSQSQCG